MSGATFQVPRGQSLSSIPNLNPGDRVELERGGVWYEPLPVYYSGAAGNPIVYTCYGSGPKPVIDLGGPLPNWSSESEWISQGGDVWTMNFGYWPGRMWFDGNEYGCPGFTNATSIYSRDYGDNVLTSQYRWWWNSGKLYVYAPSNPAKYYGSIEIAESRFQITNSVSRKSYITFQSLEFRRGCFAITLDHCDHIVFDDCKILAGTAQYGLQAVNETDYGVIQNGCVFDREDRVQHRFEYGGGPYKGNGQDNIALNCSSYWEIKDSYFSGCSHAGVNIDDGTNKGSSRYNKIHDCEFVGGGDYDRAFLMNAIYDVDGCSHNEFYRNNVHDMEVVSQLGGKQNRVYYNIFHDQKHIPWEIDQDSWRSTMIVFTDDHLQDSCYVQNNTFYNADVAAVTVAAGSRHCYVQNNLIYNPGTAGNPFDRYIGFVLWAGAQTNVIQNNLIYSPFSSTTCIVNQAEYIPETATPRTVAYLEANPGNNRISGNLAADPRIQSDFSLGSNSPATRGGIDLGFSTDYVGQAVTNPPDIGAIQYRVLTPLPAPPGLMSPVDGAALKTPEALLTWVPPAGADRVRLQVADDYFQTIKKDTTLPISVTSYKFGPVNAAIGLYYWRAAGVNTGGQGAWANPRSFAYLPDTTAPPSALTPPTLLSPPAGQSTSAGTMRFLWNCSGAGSVYRFQLAPDSSFTLSLADSASADTSLSLMLPPTAGTFWWRVGVHGTTGTMTYGTKRSLVITANPPSYHLPTPVSVSPASGFQTAPAEVKFVWSASGQSPLYRWQLAADSSFVSTLIDATLADTTMAFALDPVPGTFWWRAGVRQSDGTVSFGQKRSLIVKLPPGMLPVPVATSPAEGAAVTPGRVSFLWHASGPHALYHLQLAGDSAFTTLLADTSLADTSLAVVIPPVRGSLRWRVGVRQDDSSVVFGRSLALTVVIPSPVVSLSIDPPSLPKGGGKVHLSWSCSNTQSVRVDQGIGVVPAEGSRDVPVSRSTAFTLTAYGWGQFRNASASVLVQNSVPPAVVPVSPLPDAVLQPPAVALVWNRIPNAAGYRLQTSFDSLFQTVAVDDTALTDSVRILGGLRDGERVYWRVSARNSVGSGPFSVTSAFSLLEAAPPAGTVRVTPKLLPPGGGTVRLSWSAVNTDSVQIEPALGTCSPSGSRDIFVTSSRTFTLRAGSVTLAQAAVTVQDGFLPTLVDVTSQGKPIAAWTSAFLDRIADKVMLPPGSADPVGAYSSADGDAGRKLDWVGYEFPLRRTIAGLVFQDGPHAADGGWFDSLTLQLRVNGTWTEVTPLETTPAYCGARGPSYETYIFRLPPVEGDAVRLYGTPGGRLRFITVGELRVFTTGGPPPPASPAPSDYGLDQNYPNPFNPSTRITFRLPQQNRVLLTIYNVLGEEVARLVDSDMDAGFHTAEFSGQNLPAGVYFYFIRMGSFSRAGKMLLLR